MKKRSVGMIAALLSLSMLASCGGAAQKKDGASLDGAQGAVTGFMDAVIANDMEKAETFVADKTVIDSVGQAFQYDSLLKGSMGELSEYISDDMAKNMTNAVMDVYLKKLSYEVKTVEVNSDETSATVNITVSIPDMTKADKDDASVEKHLSDAFGFDMNDTNTLLTKYAERSGKTVNEVMASLANADENAVLKDVFKAFEPEFTTFVKSMITEILEKAETISQAEKFTVEKKDGDKWLITAIK